MWLTCEDVDLEARLLRFRAKTIDGRFWQPKTRRNRVVPISDALFEILTHYRRPHPDSRWFFASPTGLQWNPDNFSSDLRKLNKAHGLGWTCLDYRHTFGSQLAQKGESLYKISALMGNSPDICRRHYAALIHEEMADVVEFAAASAAPPPRSDDETKQMLQAIIDRLDSGQEAKLRETDFRVIRGSRPA